MKTLLPDGWPRPKGYSNGIVSEGKMVFIAGQIGWDEQEKIVSDDLCDQFRQALLNIKTLLAEANATPEHLVRLTWYLTDRDEYLQNTKEMGLIYREVFGKTYPVMAVVIVLGLIEKRAKIEIEATAVIPKQ